MGFNVDMNKKKKKYKISIAFNLSSEFHCKFQCKEMKLPPKTEYNLAHLDKLNIKNCKMHGQFFKYAKYIRTDILINLYL